MKTLTVEQELMLAACAPRERRDESEAVTRELMARAEPAQLALELAGHRVLALAGSRLEPLAELPAWFGEAIEETVRATQLRGELQRGVTRDLVARLEAAGVRTAVLKGPLLGERLYGDAGMRPSGDVDLLVLPEHFSRTLEVLTANGYSRPRTAAWQDGLPLFETSLVPERPWLPPIDLHWRVDWYDRRLSRQVLERAVKTEDGIPVLAPEDELAVMLLMFARDGLAGVRSAADVAGWWDAYGKGGGRRPLDAVWAEHPQLHRPLLAAATVVEETMGLEASKLLPASAAGQRVRLSTRLQNLLEDGEEQDRLATSTLVDWLLQPEGGRRDFVRRHLFVPAEVAAEVYGLKDRTAIRARLARVRYGAVMLAQLLPRWVAIAWRLARGRSPLALAQPSRPA